MLGCSGRAGVAEVEEAGTGDMSEFYVPGHFQGEPGIDGTDLFVYVF